MIVCQSLHVVVEGIQAKGRHESGLSQSPPDELSKAPGSLDELLGPGECGPKGTAEAFGETDRDGVIAL